MEIYTNKDETISKFIHNDGSETCIKSVPSCSFYYNELTGKIEDSSTNRNKYSVFISFSVGCPVGCKMCYLSLKNFPFNNLTKEEIYNNVIDSIKEYVRVNPENKNKYIKLCWMGMGDAFYNLNKMVEVTKQILKTVINEGWAVGLDGVDVGTTYPKLTSDIKELEHLNEYIKKVPNLKLNNNNNNDHKSIVRVFYSLHLINDREKLIPKTIETKLAIKLLRSLNIDIIFHQVFIDGITDTEENIEGLLRFFTENPELELRILRYNECNKTNYYESKKFIGIIKRFNSLPNIKYQISQGSEIKAACGQFIMKRLQNANNMG